MQQDLGKIKFGEKMYYIMDKFEYKDVEYMYIAEDIIDKVAELTEPSDVNIEVNFICKLKGEYYENIVDAKLFKELFEEENRRIVRNENPAIPRNVLKKIIESQNK